MTTQNQQASVMNFSAPDIECGGCANAIKKAVGSLTGVESVSELRSPRSANVADIATKTVAVQHDEDISETELIAALDRAGFPATVIGDK